MALSDFLTQFKSQFPEFVPILDGSTDITDDTIKTYLYIAMDLLPQHLVKYLPQASMQNLINYTTAHLLSYFNIRDGRVEDKSLLRNATSMSASGLSTSYESLAKMKGDMFSCLHDFLGTTAYGRMATLWLEKMSGTVGGSIV
jgi:hypothetical protein